MAFWLGTAVNGKLPELVLGCPAEAAPFVLGFWKFSDGKALNSHYVRAAYWIDNHLKFGLIPLGVCVVLKGLECNENACLGVSLYHPMEYHWITSVHSGAVTILTSPA
jgi:hypothetical protein